MEKAGVIPLDLSLSLRPFYITKTITDLLEDLRKIDNVQGKLSLLNESLQKHKEELAIEGRVFNGHGFPHSVLLLKESINILEEEIRKIKNQESDSGRPSTEVLPFTNKGTKSCDEEQREILGNNVGEGNAKASSTAFLVNPNHEIDNPPPCKYSAKARGKAGATKRPGLSFDPFVTRVLRTEHGRHRRSLNSDESDQTLKNRPKPISGSTLNNNRRKWTQELHAKFVEALNFLGGHEVATPKHIKQVMQMEGLTNDQVKSHLQKYRLHCKIHQSQDTSTCR